MSGMYSLSTTGGLTEQRGLLEKIMLRKQHPSRSNPLAAHVTCHMQQPKLGLCFTSRFPRSTQIEYVEASSVGVPVKTGVEKRIGRHYRTGTRHFATHT